MLKNYIFLFMISIFSWSQTKIKDTIVPKAKILAIQNKNTVIFKSETPMLNQIAGAPKAFYSYYWEFGDGNFSKQKEPKHTYKQPGTYDIKMWATNNYDTGKVPKTRPQKVTVVDKANTETNEIHVMKDNIELQRNREPSPDEDFAVVLSYKNTKNYVTNGEIQVYFNEKEFKNDNFEIIEIRKYHNETIEDENTKGLAGINSIDEGYSDWASNDKFKFLEKIQDTTEKKDLKLSESEAKKIFKNKKIIKFTNLNPNEQRNIFFTLKTKPEMIKDTSAIVRVRSIYIPDSNFENHKVKDMEMEIVTSHDPNKMSNNGFLINYRLVRFKRVKFRTRFQNDGEGPARTIRLETDVPDMFDKKTLKIESQYPECPICPKNEEVSYSCLDTIIKQKQIIFTFKNIYLPGSHQKKVVEKDSTKGFVRYSLKFGNDFHKIKTKSRTAIIFDKNQPIITNWSVTRFNPGISIGLRAGYNFMFKLENAKSFFTGFTISPFKSYRWYWQSELYFNRTNFEQNNISSITRVTTVDRPIFNSAGQQLKEVFEEATFSSKYTHSVIEGVPISIRYNINNYIGIGFGPQLTVIADIVNEKVQTFKYFERVQRPQTATFFQGEQLNYSNDPISESVKEKNQFQTQLFIDATFGFARIGPSVGVRFLKNFNQSYDALQLYAIWKF